MKKAILILLAICLMLPVALNAQGGLLKKVAGSMKDELLGTKKAGNTEPEPTCACNDAEMVVGLGGKLQIDYKEAEFSGMDDGSLLIKERNSNNYYIVKDGVTTGPVSQGDPRLAGFVETDNSNDAMAGLLQRYKDYISKSGDKYLITFGGKQYGPFAQITRFVVPKSKDKFVAVVTESVLGSEAEGKKMDEAIKNAKTDQEKMDLAMQYGQQMAQKVMQAGGATAITPKFITNIPGISDNMSVFSTGTPDGNIKYDDIVIVNYTKINDLTGKTLITLQPGHVGQKLTFLNTANNRYAVYSYGTLYFSDGKSMTDLFNPFLTKTGSQVYLAYMYYSPRKNAIMQCKIPW